MVGEARRGRSLCLTLLPSFQFNHAVEHADREWFAAGGAEIVARHAFCGFQTNAAGAVAVVAAHGHRIAALTGPDPAVGLLLFDLRTCLGDAFAAEGGVQ